MAGCTHCEHLVTSRLFRTPGELGAAIRAVQGYVRDDLLAVDADWPLEQLKPPVTPFVAVSLTPPWPPVMIYHFRCTHCGQLYCLSAESRQGAQGRWTSCQAE
jgi:hypothetical protein